MLDFTFQQCHIQLRDDEKLLREALNNVITEDDWMKTQ